MFKKLARMAKTYNVKSYEEFIALAESLESKKEPINVLFSVSKNEIDNLRVNTSNFLFILGWKRWTRSLLVSILR